MKKTILLSAVFLCFLACGSLKKTQRNINTGNYDEAIRLAVKKLRKNKSNKASKSYILALQEAFEKAVLKDKQQIAFLKKENNPDNFEKLYNFYITLSDRQEYIKPLLPLTLYKTNKRATFNFENYQNDIIETKSNLVAYLYDRASLLLSSGNKYDYRKAHNDFRYIKDLSPNYKNTNSLIKEAHAKGTDYVFVSINNETRQIIPRRLEDELLNFDTYGLDDFWTVYQSNKNKNIDYDYRLELNFRRIDISPEKVVERHLVKERQIKDGFKYAKDKNGKIQKDSLGNKIKIDKFKAVRCEFYEFTQRKFCNMIAKVNYINEKSNQLLESFPIESSFVFEHIYADYDGDKRALEAFMLDLLGQREVRFPSNEQMVYDSGQDLKQKLKAIITRNKFRN